MKNKFTLSAALRVASKLLLGFAILGLVFLFGGCASPSAVEQFLFTPSTNHVPVVTSSVETVAVTNDTGGIELQNTVTWRTNIEAQVTYSVSTNGAALVQTGGAISSIYSPGSGELVATGVFGLLALWAKFKGNKAQKGNAVLTQGIETLLAVIETKHGKQFTDGLKAKLARDQEAAGVLREIATLVRQLKPDNEHYRVIAEQLLKALPEKPAA